MSIKDISLSRVIIRLFFLSVEPFIENFQNFKKSSELLLLSFFYKEFSIKMATKTKLVASSLSAAAPEVQMGGSSRQEAPILGKESSDLVFAIKGLEELS